MYSFLTKSWKYLPSAQTVKLYYRVCSYMQKLFEIGGNNDWGRYERSCMFYDEQILSWSYIVIIMEGRENAACTVFEWKL